MHIFLKNELFWMSIRWECKRFLFIFPDPHLLRQPILTIAGFGSSHLYFHDTTHCACTSVSRFTRYPLAPCHERWSRSSLRYLYLISFFPFPLCFVIIAWISVIGYFKTLYNILKPLFLGSSTLFLSTHVFPTSFLIYDSYTITFTGSGLKHLHFVLQSL